MGNAAGVRSRAAARRQGALRQARVEPVPWLLAAASVRGASGSPPLSFPAGQEGLRRSALGNNRIRHFRASDSNMRRGRHGIDGTVLELPQ